VGKKMALAFPNAICIIKTAFNNKNHFVFDKHMLLNKLRLP